ncbi:hypothetical protein [Metabacillus bambusae]|uniref:Uncharacterized protein n=1 Tax=Metabacillus bambusae TaxID=2795218 RepID=A0ABS3NB85_9BACI|nr:hypothetical protein [Metabacillus bambusae]MBO1515259.1 hypothetical protein [Metabacillus bambusae]
MQPDNTLTITATYVEAPYFELTLLKMGTYSIKSLANNMYLSVSANLGSAIESLNKGNKNTSINKLNSVNNQVNAQ